MGDYLTFELEKISVFGIIMAMIVRRLSPIGVVQTLMPCWGTAKPHPRPLRDERRIPLFFAPIDSPGGSGYS
jgi:hypothetical protein